MITDKEFFLYHYPLNSFCRKVRLTLLEKGIPAKLVMEKTWERRTGFLQINPLGEVPVLVESDGAILSGHQTICEYLNESKSTPNLLGETPLGRAEVRRLTEWLDGAFFKDAIYPILLERVIKVVATHEIPDSNMIRAGRENLQKYMKYLDWLAARRSFLGGQRLSFADLSAAAHFSVLDYLGELSFQGCPELALWYAKIKSRPAFVPLLSDKVVGILPAVHYADLDF